MGYCTSDDILSEIPQATLIQLTDDSIPPVVVNQTVVDKAIADADDLINGYVGERYQVPITNVTALVKTMATDIAVYRIYLRRKAKGMPELVQKAYDNTMKLLLDVQKGRLSLGVSSAGSPVTTSSDDIQVSAPGRVFTRDTLSDY